MSAQCPTCGNRAIRRGATSRPGFYKYQCPVKGCPTNYFTAGENSYQPRLLVLDIETLPAQYYAWSPKTHYLGRHMMIKDWSLLSYAAKWVGDDKIIASVLTPEEAVNRDDSRLAKELHRLLDMAHIVITHNGRNFDIKMINTRLWKHRLSRPSHYKVIDTLVEVNKTFAPTYKSLEYIAEFKEREQKLHTNMALWIGADHGNPESLRKMLEYNEQDVIVQEEIYMDIREWMPNHPPLTIYTGEDGCPVCLHQGYKQIGFYYANRYKYPEYRCDKCRSVWHSSKSVKRKEG